MNFDIRVREVRVIDADGEQIGILPTKEAMARAKEAGLDLVEVSPNAKPPVCRIMDYGKFQYQQKKRATAAKKKQHKTQVKIIQFRPGTGEGDYQVKLRNLIRFLENGDKARVIVRFRGREMSHRELGLELLERVEKDLTDYGQVEQRPKLEGRQMLMVVAPKQRKAKPAKEESDEESLD